MNIQLDYIYKYIESGLLSLERLLELSAKHCHYCDQWNIVVPKYRIKAK